MGDGAAMQQVADWLEKLGLGQYAQRFAENDISFAVLPDLTDQDLKEIGVSLGHRRLLLREIANLNKTAAASPAPSSPAALQVVAPPVERQPEATGERRHVTMMFCDLVDSTGIAAKLDAEEWRDLVGAYVDAALAALKRNRHGQRDWLIGLLIYRHGLRVSEACDLRWDDIDLPKRTIIVRRLKGSTDSTHYLERDEQKALGDLRRAYAAKGIKSDYVFVNERGEPFGRMGIARKIEHAGEAAGLPFPIHVHMLRHSTGYALAAKGMDTRRLQHFLGHASITNTVRYTAMSPEPFKDVWR